MTVRWRPLIVLSGLFLVVGMLGLTAIGYALMPGKTTDLLRLARAEAGKQEYERAIVQYRRALQRDPRNAEIHEEIAGFLAAWIKAKPEKRLELQPQRLRTLNDAAKYGPSRPSPRRLLLVDALENGDPSEARHWAKELLPLEPDNIDAHFVLADEALERDQPDLAAASPHVKVLERDEASSWRTAWTRARVFRAADDSARLSELLAETRARGAQSGERAVEAMARMNLRELDLQQAESAAEIATRIDAFRAEAERMASDESATPSRYRQLGVVVERALRDVESRSATFADLSAERKKELRRSLDEVAENVFTKAIDRVGKTDLRAHLAYAEHLRSRDQEDRCIEVVTKALQQPIALLPAWMGEASALRECAVKAALAKTSDPKRFERAAPFISDLVASPNPTSSGLGHLFQGVIDLERSGLTTSARTDPSAAVAKIRATALTHLKAAATNLSESPTALALYGVALILSDEDNLGRQYLSKAHQLGSDRLEPRYQIWAAWSMVHAGYPEDAEPIVQRLFKSLSTGETAKDLEPTLHVLMGEIHQARRDPASLKKAKAEYETALAAGQPATSSLETRIAQIDLLLGESKSGLDRLQRLQDRGDSSAIRLAVVYLRDQKHADQANALLAEARKRQPDAEDLLELAVGLNVNDGKPEEADRILREFLTRHPDRIAVVSLRARVLAGPLKKPDEARKLLASVSDQAPTSDVLVQLAMMELAQGDFTAVEKTIAAVRARWKESAVVDLLSAQLAYSRKDLPSAAAHLDSALKKDPRNKVAQFWRAQLDDRAGAGSRAATVYESILKEKPIKELEAGLSLTAAAQWALAGIALENRDLDSAITRYQDLIRGQDGGELVRPARWKLALTLAAKGRADEAKREIATLLSDPATTDDERVQAADFYRRQHDDSAAVKQLDMVIKHDPSHVGAITYRALMLTARGKAADAAAWIHRAIAVPKDPKSVSENLFLTLAAIENLAPPAATGPARVLAAVEQGLSVHPDSIELLRAKYAALKLANQPNAAYFIEQKVEKDPRPAFRRLLIDVYRQERDFEKAETLVRTMIENDPKDASLAATLVALIAARSQAASEVGDAKAAARLDANCEQLIARYRKEFPAELSFPQAECELAARTGELAKAKRLAQEVSDLDTTSPLGALLQARIAATENRFDEMARAYEEAMRRAPGRSDVRLALGELKLRLGDAPEALKQAEIVLESDTDSAPAKTLHAQALAAETGAPGDLAARREQAIESMRQLLKAQPANRSARHLIAEIQLLGKNRDAATQTLRKCLELAKDDDEALSLLLQLLCQPSEPGKTTSDADVREAVRIAEAYCGGDVRGTLSLAAALGFQRGGRSDIAAPWAEKAAAKLDRPVVHLTYGDILLALAESMTDRDASKDVFNRAVAAYDRVLTAQPLSIEAANNKAWILHRYLDQNSAALEVVESFGRKAPADRLPPEFLDTWGSIHAAMNHAKEAEQTFARGLRIAPDHPALNFHMGRLLAADPDRSRNARTYLEKALSNRARLEPGMATEAEASLAKLGRPSLGVRAN